RQQAYRPQVDVLVELAPEQQQGAPERHMVGHRVRPADRAEIDRIAALEALFPVLGHHPAMACVILAAGKVEMAPVEPDAEALAGGLEDLHALGHDFGADAVTGDHRNTQCTHRFIPWAQGGQCDRPRRRSTFEAPWTLKSPGRHAAGNSWEPTA